MVKHLPHFFILPLSSNGFVVCLPFCEQSTMSWYIFDNQINEPLSTSQKLAMSEIFKGATNIRTAMNHTLFNKYLKVCSVILSREIWEWEYYCEWITLWTQCCERNALLFLSLYIDSRSSFVLYVLYHFFYPYVFFFCWVRIEIWFTCSSFT